LILLNWEAILPSDAAQASYQVVTLSKTVVRSSKREHGRRVLITGRLHVRIPMPIRKLDPHAGRSLELMTSPRWGKISFLLALVFPDILILVKARS
jgi:hypothetical protein